MSAYTFIVEIKSAGNTFPVARCTTLSTAQFVKTDLEGLFELMSTNSVFVELIDNCERWLDFLKLFAELIMPSLLTETSFTLGDTVLNHIIGADHWNKLPSILSHNEGEFDIVILDIAAYDKLPLVGK